MNKRFWVICSIICLGLLTLSVLGLSSLGMHEKGLRAERQQEFMAVARQISFDVKKKVDAFLQTEQGRPYTQYQPYFVPQTSNQAMALVQSPLVDSFSNGLAGGYFQLEPDGRLTSPHFQQSQVPEASETEQYAGYFENIRQNLLPSLQNGRTIATHRVEPTPPEQEKEMDYDKVSLGLKLSGGQQKDIDELAVQRSSSKIETIRGQESREVEVKSKVPSKSKGTASRRSVYPISSLEKAQQPAQVLTQSRANYEMNVYGNEAAQTQGGFMPVTQSNETPDQQESDVIQRARQITSALQQQAANQPAAYPFDRVQQSASVQSDSEGSDRRDSQTASVEEQPAQMAQLPDETVEETASSADAVDQAVQSEDFLSEDFNRPLTQQMMPTDTVQVRIEPFVPMTVSNSNGNNGIFAGQVYLLRHVQIENRHLVQGFQLNEDELLSQVAESARRLLRRGMGYELSKAERPDAAFAAVLQFDFGEIVLNLLELEPGYIQAQVVRIRNWFFGILAVVWLSVLIAMAALWKNMRQQVLLSRKKDDFISAVSHELRTPLTSIRMYTEMLEKNWVKTDEKRSQYYTTMRQESERLSRLIENVLDFSRIQRGKKKYEFAVGDVNECIREVAEMMRPYIERAGFTLVQELSDIAPFMFDRDAVTQIVINLLDNALKYAKSADDKRIILRTHQPKGMVLIEVQDHGPGIGRGQQKKIFEAFYRCEDESTRQSTGTGLGLALVKRFAEAHAGFVEILNIKPTGACFRVALSSQ